MKSLYDTCVYIDFLRNRKHEGIFTNRLHIRYLSPVVMMELRAGVSTSRDVKSLDGLFNAYIRANRLVSISPIEFAKAGKIISDIKTKHGSVKNGLSHDILIALTAASIGATLFTSNGRDF